MFNLLHLGKHLLYGLVGIGLMCSSAVAQPPVQPPEHREPNQFAADQPSPFTSIKDWRVADEQVVRYSTELKRVDDKQAAVHDMLDQERMGYEPGRFGPGSIMARRRIAQRLAEAERLADEIHPIREKMHVQARRIQGGRNAILRQLEEWLPTVTDPKEKKRMKAWIEGLESIPSLGFHGFIYSVVGHELARTPPRHSTRPDPNGGQGRDRYDRNSGGRGGRRGGESRPGDRETNPNSRGPNPQERAPAPGQLSDVRQKLERLQRRQEMMIRNLEKMTKEIDQLTSQLDSLEQAREPR